MSSEPQQQKEGGRPRLLYHFTSLNNFASILNSGQLKCDGSVQEEGSLVTEIGDLAIKAKRRNKQVPVGPGGPLADYVPFYFAPRSPMLFRIWKGTVATYSGSQDSLVYLVTSVERIIEMDLPFVFTDRHPLAAFARFSPDEGELNTVDWGLMRARMWADTDADPDRKHSEDGRVPHPRRCAIDGFSTAAVSNDATLATVRKLLEDRGITLRVELKPGWYFL